MNTFVRTFISVKRLNEYFKIEEEYKEDGTIEKEIKAACHLFISIHNCELLLF